MAHTTPRPCFIVNPKSAGGRTGRRWESYATRLSNELEGSTIRMTRSAGDGKAQTRRALDEGYNLIVSIGGDGTNNEVINGFFHEDGSLVSPEAEFMFYPSGSGGDLRRSLMPAQNLDALIQGIKHGRSRRLDIGRTRFVGHDGKSKVQFFLNIGSIGLSGLICNYVNNSSKPLGGTVAFYIASAKALFNYTSPEVQLTIDDEEPETLEIQTIAIANGRYYGGGMMIAPGAELDDGIFDITILRKTAASASSRRFFEVACWRKTRRSVIVERVTNKCE